ncbi:hypothetical protein ACKVMT_17340 [Halobacteriales archaeon Cl-PHB]
MGALGDIIVSALKELLRVLFSPLTKIVEENASQVVKAIVETPHPNAVFARPTNGPWPGLYDYHWDAIVPLSLTLWGLAVGLVIFLETTSHLFSSYHRSRLVRRAFAGLLGILTWWWVVAIALRFVTGLTGFLVPDLSEITLLQSVSFGAMGLLGTVIALAANFVLFALLALVYLVRRVVLYLFVLLMPVLVALWIPGVGPFGLVSGFMRRLAGFFTPFLFMTVPVAVLFRLGEILGGSFGNGAGGFMAWVTALVIPFLALVIPLVFVWQAGALLFVADRMARHVSGQRARQRVGGAAARASQGAHGGRNFSRGVQGKPAVQRDGQAVLGSGDSRAHRAGTRVREAVTRTRGSASDAGGSADGTAASGSEPSRRADSFDTLRRDDRADPADGDAQAHDRDPSDDEPRYIY